MSAPFIGNNTVNANVRPAGNTGTLDRIQGGVAPGSLNGLGGLNGDLNSFKGVLEEKLGAKLVAGQPALNAQGVKFSQHAIDRMRSRGISLDPSDLEKLNKAVEKASQKGSKDTLVIMDGAAMVVNIKNKTVVTAMDTALMKENVFTNIDSTVLI